MELRTRQGFDTAQLNSWICSHLKSIETDASLYGLVAEENLEHET
jgi:hypothetical protein